MLASAAPPSSSTNRDHFVAAGGAGRFSGDDQKCPRTLGYDLSSQDRRLVAYFNPKMFVDQLNRMKQRLGGRGIYSVTEATTAQREILHALRLSHLTNDEAVARILSS